MKYVTIFALLVSLAVGANITDLTISSEGTNTKLAIKSDAPFVANAFTLKDPARIVIDCSGATSMLVGKTFAVNSGGITELSVTGFSERSDMIRIVGKLDREYSFLSLTEGNDFVVTLLTNLSAPIALWQAISGQVVAAAPTQPTAPPDVTTTKPPATPDRKSVV